MAKEKLPRQAMPEQEPLVRAHNFLEVPFGYTAELAIAEATRCIQCKNPKCIAGCPVGIDIPAFIKLIAQGEFAASARKIKEMNALPAVCGRVCPQEDQCEKVCVVGIKQEPVAIGRLERFVADFERENNLVTIPEKAPVTGKRIAVVGSGPAGLTVAGDLALLGHEVTVFEALHKAGGVLVYGIPEFRLPKSIVQKEVDYLTSLGVNFVFNSVIGRSYTVSELMEEEKFDAVFLGTGAGLPYFMNIPGENFNGVYSANEFLTRSNLMRAFDFPQADTPIQKGKRVAVLGGGNVAMDAARTALRLGADKVIVAYRRSRKEMPARIEEIHHAEQEGIEFQFLTAPIEILGDDQGWVRAMKMQRMELGEPDASGRRRPVVIEGSEYETEFDSIVVSIGNGSNPLIPHTTPGLNTNKWGNITADDNGATSIPGVYAGGDVVIGAATVILAMGMARKSSKAMHEYLMGAPVVAETAKEAIPS